jgi:hypothetical protein
VSDRSPETCGATNCTTPCPSDSDGIPICPDGTQCTFECDQGFNACIRSTFDASCDSGNFEFESSLEGARPDGIGTAPVTLATSTRIVRTGTGSIEMIVNIPQNAAAAARRTGMRMPLCSRSGRAELELPNLRTFYFIDGPAFPAGTQLVLAFESASRGEVRYRSHEPPLRGEWIDLGGRVTLDTSDVVGIRMWIEIPIGTWTGFIYFDDVFMGVE